MSEASHLLKARWVFPVASPPIEDGVVAIEQGNVVRIGSGSEPDAIDLGDVAMIPGLVNAHTHLEFSHLREPFAPSRPFAAWVRSVVASRGDGSASVAHSLHTGIEESIQAGTTCLGEIATSPLSAECLDAAAMPSVAFWEVLGLDPAIIEARLEAVESHLGSAKDQKDSFCDRGLSPHAPYSLHPELFRRTVDRAAESRVPVAMHLAETREELELLHRQSGPLVEMLREFGLWREGLFSPDTAIQMYLEALARLERVLIIHGNYLTSEEINYLAERPQFSVVYCPRTHAFFGHDAHPWRQLLERGVNVAVGTDSRASNPDLNLWGEVQHLWQCTEDVGAETLLRIATINGASALGLEQVAGVIAPGRAADLAVVAFGEQNSAAPPHERLLHPASRIVRTMRCGHWHAGIQKPPSP